jgi:predicted sulfurtransferase
MMKRGLSAVFLLGLSLALVGMLTMTTMAAEEAPRIAKEELKAMLGTPDVVVLDVRAEGSWKASEAKIESAIRENPAEVASWSGNYSKDQTVILYCS